jgi:signal transduction histidine kinase
LSATTPATDSDLLLDQLRSIPLFSDLQDADRGCIGRAEERTLVAGEILIEEGAPATHFFVLLEGEVSVSKMYGDQRVVVARYRPGTFFGEVPLLLDVPYILTARAEVDSRLIVFPAEGFWGLLRLCPLIAGEIFRAMAVRLRNLEGSNRQQEKLASLGRMSAGLAHELNNPAAAAQRVAVYLGELIQTIQTVAHELHQTLEGDHWDRLIKLADDALKSPAANGSNHSIEQSDSEDVLGAWLKENGVPNAWKIAPILVGTGVESGKLASLRVELPPGAFGNAIRWIALRLTIRSLLDDAEQSTGRIASLVDAVRSSARQERAETADIDVPEQIRSALSLLESKLKNIRVTQHFSTEGWKVRGYPSELAQVWVNLLDNAIDAIGSSGEISIRSHREDNQTVVEIVDNGPGVAPENISQIFEPFFTTKGVGSGKGLGLTISQGIVGDRHGGEIEVESKPGETRFIVRLPVHRIERNDTPEALAANRVVMAELAERFEEIGPATSSPAVPVADGAFATVFDVPLFATLGSVERACFSTGQEMRFKTGDTVISEGDASHYFHVMLEGELRVTKFFDNQEIFLGVLEPGEFFGEIQILLDISHVVRIRAISDGRIFSLPRAGFWDLLRTAPQVAREIMRTLATRLRNMEGYTQEREKLAQLGAMAAGLAHELNNPATAARNAARNLRENVEEVQDFACELNQTLSAEQWLELVAAAQDAVHCNETQPKLNPLEQGDREEAVENWLNAQNVEDAWELAPVLVNARIGEEELQTLKRTVPPQDLTNALRWLTANITTRDLLKSITHSTERISELVSAVKSYSFMDQAPWQEIDVHEGIENTLIILGHKLKNATVTRDFDRTLPQICAYGGELNQVWTNLIDNAIYAVNGTGRIDIRTRRDGPFFLVEISDNGSGIPIEAQSHIFSVPFFTTKGRSGTGLGLVISHRIIVERHGGKIEFSTAPNGTRFSVRLPFESAKH